MGIQAVPLSMQDPCHYPNQRLTAKNPRNSSSAGDARRARRVNRLIGGLIPLSLRRNESGACGTETRGRRIAPWRCALQVEQRLQVLPENPVFLVLREGLETLDPPARAG